MAESSRATACAGKPHRRVRRGGGCRSSAGLSAVKDRKVTMCSLDPLFDSSRSAAPTGPVPRARSSILTVLAASSLVVAACQDESPLTQPSTDPAPSASPAAAALANSWSSGAPMPAGRFGHAAESITSSTGDPLVYVFGGIEADPNQEQTAEGTVQVYNYRTDSWSTRTPTPSGIGWTNGVGRIGNRFYLAGGGSPQPDE